MRPNETNTQAAEATANDQQQNVRKPDVDKTNSPEAGVHIDPTSEAFPQTMVGNTSDARTVTLTNTGTTPLKMGVVATNNGEFPVPSSPCANLIAAGGNVRHSSQIQADDNRRAQGAADNYKLR